MNDALLLRAVIGVLAAALGACARYIWRRKEEDEGKVLVEVRALGATLSGFTETMGQLKHTLFGATGREDDGVVAEVKRLRGFRHDTAGHLQGIAGHLGLELLDDGRVREDGSDTPPAVERRFHVRRAAERAGARAGRRRTDPVLPGRPDDDPA
ncbi:hypothetical protein tb265_39140 [Gemmatimonadetes bacterium T265]|nr:hypothetical protein tb265_39140 [Gemmatimonadetes bacterium T265]